MKSCFIKGDSDAIQSAYALVSGLRLHYLAVQSPAAVAVEPMTLVFLHGFPEHAGVWQAQLGYFSSKYRAIALDLPGYNLSEGPNDLTGYAVPNLVEVVAEFLRVVSHGEKVVLIAHDWGGALAWPLASRYPELLSHLVILNAAHPSTFTREMLHNKRQRSMSDYIHDFLHPDAETQLCNNQFEHLKQHSIHHIAVDLSAEDVEHYMTAWSRPNAVTNMLNYYRAMPQLFAREGAQTQADQHQQPAMKIPDIRISVPTLVLWGEQDQAFDSGVLTGLGHYIDDYTEVRFADATHWLHHEIPDEISRHIAEFITSPPEPH
ncbi:alpha/beta fold hydrolase [Alteromonas oceanisediminis]|uniref:alpha/beta fold hydrolase n=1 Tax=Alteromonas oceanisediminis TaxID=2836180 RepID=UPI001BD9BCFD|nr:alpha/beta hydrolase [Alteromonas oceanisediminis]MBT0588199.1 alpha/beta hydrolase [Alteromonas oceanisediminis]